jgi:hypothetical protein
VSNHTNITAPLPIIEGLLEIFRIIAIIFADIVAILGERSRRPGFLGFYMGPMSLKLFSVVNILNKLECLSTENKFSSLRTRTNKLERFSWQPSQPRLILASKARAFQVLSSRVGSQPCPQILGKVARGEHVGYVCQKWRKKLKH